MHHSRGNTTTLRRLVAIASAALALVAMAAQPALAVGGDVVVERGFSLDGARTHLQLDGRMLDSAKGAGMTLSANFGSGETGTGINLRFAQLGAGTQSREVVFEGWGAFKAVAGPGCIHETMGGGYGLARCEFLDFDWELNRTYRMTIVRGTQNDKGWLWTVKLTDLQTKTVTKIVSFRMSYAKLSAAQYGPHLFANPGDCTNVDTVVAKIAKPVARDSSVTWGEASAHAHGCEDISGTAEQLKTGATKFKIAQ